MNKPTVPPRYAFRLQDLRAFHLVGASRSSSIQATKKKKTRPRDRLFGLGLSRRRRGRPRGVVFRDPAGVEAPARGGKVATPQPCISANIIADNEAMMQLCIYGF
jgi:hypothetical protein